MGSFDSMKNKLAPLGVYSLEDGSTTVCELKAYSEGLDPLFNRLEEFERESFIATAETYGLSERERFSDKEKPDLTVEQRRALLTGLEQDLGAKGTPNGFTKHLNDNGIMDFSIDEYPTRQRMSIYINDDLNSAQIKRATKIIAQAVPSHINVKLFFSDDTQIDI